MFADARELLIKVSSTAEITAGLPAPSPTTPPSLEIPANHLAAELSRTQLLLSLPPVPAVSLPPTEREDKISFDFAFEICRDAQILLSTTMPDLKLEHEKLAIITSKIERMESIMAESVREIRPAKKLNYLKIISVL